MSFKDLNLNMELIPHKIQEFSDEDIQITQKGTADHYKFTKDGCDCLLIVHKRNKGTVTLQVAGKNQELSYKAAEYVAQEAQHFNSKNFAITVPDFDRSKLDTLIQYLCEECRASLIAGPIEKDLHIQYKLTGKQNDNLNFNLYHTGKLVVQGRPIRLAMDLINFLAEEENISSSDLLSYVGDVFGTVTTVKQARDNFEKYYPYTFSFAGENLKKLFSTAISMQNATTIIEDNSVICFPALRCLESFIKSAVLYITGDIWNDFEGVFYKEQRPPFSYRLTSNYQNQIGCDKTCNLLEECYTYFNKQRHSLFHANALDSSTRLIEERGEAVEISRTALALIEKYSKQLQEKYAPVQSS